MKRGSSKITREKFQKLVSTILIVCIWLLIFNELTSQNYYFINSIHNVYLKTFFDNLNNVQYILLTYAIIFTWLFFYLYKNKILEIENEEDRNILNNLKAEENRKIEFENKYPRISKIPILRIVIKWMYWEGWKYSIGLVIIILLWFVIRIVVATKFSIHIDEWYTNTVTKWLFKYWEIWLTESWLDYNRSPIYNFINSWFYYIFDDIHLQLRFLDILLFSLFTPLIYILIKQITNSSKISLISTAIINLNWYVIIITTVARSYCISMILILVSFYFMIKIINKERIFLNIILLFFSLIINFLQWTSLWVYHILPLLFIVFIYLFNDFKDKKIIISLLIFIWLLLFYITIIDSTIIFTIINYFQPYLRLEIIMTFWSLISYFNIIWITILLIFLIFTLYNKIIINKVLLYWIIFVIIFQWYLFWTKTFDFRYLFSIIIPVLFLFSYNLIKIFNFYKLNILSFIILSLYIFTNIFNVFNLYDKNLDWIIAWPQPWDYYIDNIPNGSIVLTDFPIVPFTLRDDLILYKISFHPKDTELINYNLDFKYKRWEYSENEIKRVFNFLENEHIKYKETFTIEQDYDIITWSPRIQTEVELINIINLNKDKEIYALITYETYKNKRRYIDLFNYINNNWTTILQNEIIKNVYDNRDNIKNNNLTLIKIH